MIEDSREKKGGNWLRNHECGQNTHFLFLLNEMAESSDNKRKESPVQKEG